MTTTSTAPMTEATELSRTPFRAVRWFTDRPRLLDLIGVIACLSLQLAALTLTEPQSYWLGFLIAVCCSSLLFWRRRFPMTVLSIIVLFGAVGTLIDPALGTSSLPFAFALYTVAQGQKFSRAAIGYGVGIAVPALSMLFRAGATGESFSPLILDPFALLAVTLGLAVRNRRQRQEAFSELLTQRTENARVVERNRITAEMHDVVAHSLSVMIALADGASTGWEKHPERSATALKHLSTVGRDALTDMSRILYVLRDGDVDLASSLHRSGHNLPTLDELVEVVRSTGLPVQLTRTGKPLPDDPILATNVYRIVQEALTNSLRYATDATRINVHVDADETQLHITVTDDGRTPAAAKTSHGSGRGLLGIAERAASYGGISTAGPLPTGGWCTTAQLRLDGKEEDPTS